ncbi:MAG: dihydropteroate synthase [Deltaproteobacteria bacterium]
MGVVNLTPDSFFAGSRAATVDGAVAAALALAAQGADLLDVGGESTRPGAVPVGEDEECGRVLPVIERLAALTAVPISIDTMKAGVAEAAVAAGASLVNDISGGLADTRMAPAAAALAVPVILGHIQGTPATMQNSPSYNDVLPEIRHALGARVAAFVAAGVEREAILVDPGIGFGKRPADNAAILGGLPAFAALGLPVVLGVSRKRFLGAFLEEAGLADSGPEGRLEASLAAAVIGAQGGAAIVRVHDVGATRRALAVVEGLGSGWQR